jgi:hypothetical protein
MRPHLGPYGREHIAVLGKLYPFDKFESLSGNEQNPNPNGVPVQIWNSPGIAESTMRIPDIA